MWISFLKSGRYAHPEPSKGLILAKAGGVTKVDESLGASMISNGWAEAIDLDKLTKADLVALGAPEDSTKAEMINALR